MNDHELNDDEKRALKAYTDVLAVEWDEQAGVARVLTLSDVYTAVPSEGMHLCPDREYHDVDMCKHLWALETVRGRVDAPEGWLVVEDFDTRTEPEFDVTAGLGDFEDFRVVTDGGRERFEAVCEGCGLNTIVEWDGEEGLCDSCRGPCDETPMADGGTDIEGVTLCWDDEDCPEDDCNGELQQQDRFNVMCLSCEGVWSHVKTQTKHFLQTVDFETVGEKPRVATDGGQVVPEGLDQWTVWDPERENAHHFDNRGEAEDKMDMADDMNIPAKLFPPGESPEAMYHADGSPDVDAEPTSEPAEDADAGPVEDCAECGDPVPIREARAGPGGKPTHGDCDGDDEAPSREVDPGRAVREQLDDETSTDGGETVVDDAPDPEPAPDANHEPEVLSADEVEQYAADLDDREVGQDPLKWMPGEFVDTIEGTEAINRRGFEVLRYFYNVDLDVEMEVDPEDNDMTHCRFKCVADMDGEEIEAWGTSHVDRGDDPWLLVEMAATRARKRALSIATGAGAVAVAELRNEVEQ